MSSLAVDREEPFEFANPFPITPTTGTSPTATTAEENILRDRHLHIIGMARLAMSPVAKIPFDEVKNPREAFLTNYVELTLRPTEI
jgi:hypothetical protein